MQRIRGERPRLLDLFCGAGGAAMGYNMAGFEVIGVDNTKQPHYPFHFIKADAVEYAVAHAQDYHAVHASPPCQRWSVMTPKTHRANHPDLIVDTRRILSQKCECWVIENVEGARTQLIQPLMLCGSMFGQRFRRHRYFEINTPSPTPTLILTPGCRHLDKCVLITDHGASAFNGHPRKRTPVAIKREAIGIDWMTEAELSQAIPPTYTKFIGEYLLTQINNL